MKLYSYFRSSAAYRVRIALNLKGLDFDVVPVHLVKNGGEQNSADYAKLNPTKLVPTLVNEGFSLGQSIAILEYLEEEYPDIPLLPEDTQLRAKIRAFVQHIACDIHPVNNLRILQYLTNELGVSEDQKLDWYAHWIHKGFIALEEELSKRNTLFCFGDSPTMADCCLIPQIYNAQRFKLDLASYPRLLEVNNNCIKLKAFIDAAPEQQIDAV